ncbi:MAG: hypothetical protein HYT38_02685 [Candidatus Sungbacteria bacterium]|uniref:Uncharacterized protein n=1 Tax=Candidatus Sungiibacteriota bacterium TaxID=2750080 RepID=A0A9D6DQS0_9BACT|nr:hypothetical protein [Candidatus Sungbacteria bacterium]
MATAVRRKDPQIRWYHPVWCHHHGAKMRVEQVDPQNHILIISGSAAEVTIRKASSMSPDVEGWFVDWEVVQERPYGTGVRGRSWFSDKDLAAAFGLSDDSGVFGDWLIDQFGADSAEQGKYIRWKGFLNIPCPGTGHDGDPNVSIHLDDEIRNAVQQLFS